MLKTRDLFIVQKIYKKMELKEEMKKMTVDVTDKTEEERNKISSDKSIEFVNLIIENIDKAEQEVYQLLANYSDKTVDEIENQDLFDTLDEIKELITDERLINFFKSPTQSKK